MSSTMNEKDLKQLRAHVTELAKGLKSEADLSSLTQQLVKMTVEAALGAELDDHLGYEKHDPTGRGSGNSRNGTTKKRLKGQHGEVEVAAPRDRAGTFEPQFVRKGQTRLTQMDDQILALYAKGLSTRDIVEAFKEMYDADVSATLISKVTDRVLETVVEWQNRPIDPVYPHRLSGLHRPENPPQQERHQQIHVPCPRDQHGRPEGAAGPVAGGNRGR